MSKCINRFKDDCTQSNVRRSTDSPNSMVVIEMIIFYTIDKYETNINLLFMFEIPISGSLAIERKEKRVTIFFFLTF